MFTNVRNPRADVDRRGEFERTRVGRGATIGANATIVCGHDIGDYAFIGAGAVVTDDVPAHALIVGVPGRRIGWVSHAGERLGPDLVCSRTGNAGLSNVVRSSSSSTSRCDRRGGVEAGLQRVEPGGHVVG